MYGVSDQVVNEWGESALLTLLSGRATSPAAYGLYQRKADDPARTMTLPCRHHLHYASQGFLLVKILDPAALTPETARQAITADATNADAR